MSAQPTEAAAVAPSAPPTEKLAELSLATESKSSEPTIGSERKDNAEATAAVTSAPVPSKDGPSDTAALVLENKEASPVAAPAPESLDQGVTLPAATSGPTWPETAADHPLTQFFSSIAELTSQADHNEVFGITLSIENSFLTKLILQKYLRANANDLAKAKEQLLETLKWRKEFQPQKAAEEKHDKSRFEGLGYILEVDGVPESGNKKDIVTFNIYGAVKDAKLTFGDLEGFLRWRIGLMERSIQKLNLSTATQPIPDYNEGPDPYQGFQIHDYLSVSFLRMDPAAKASSKRTIEILGRYYPETLSRKFFVNVPVVMQWMYAAMKLFVAKETQKKFSVLSYGNQLALELGEGIPKEYGGSKGSLAEVGEALALESKGEAEKK